MDALWIDSPKLLSPGLEDLAKHRRTQTHVLDAINSIATQGYVILRQAVPVAVCEAVNSFNDQVWKNNLFRLKSELAGKVGLAEEDQRHRHYRLLDTYAHSQAVREAFFQPAIISVLEAIFRSRAKVFQSLTFERGTEQAIHQDPAYVVLKQPTKLLAIWIALEDILPGTGELIFYPGSHRVVDFKFGPPGQERTHWNPSIDGREIHLRYLEHIHAVSRDHGLQLEKFSAHQGDVLIWHAMLAHGGSRIEVPNSTRRSLVGHYCPIEVGTNYDGSAAYGKVFRDPQLDAYYSSGHYSLPGGLKASYFQNLGKS